MNDSTEQPGFLERRERPATLPPVYEAMRETRRDLPSPPLQQSCEVEEEEGTAHLRRFAAIIRKHRWKIVAFVALAVAATGVITKLVPPLYEADAKINVERRNNGFIGQQASQPSASFDLEQVMSTQVELIKSDPVLRPATEKYHLLDLEHQFRGLMPEEAARLRTAPIKLKRLKVARVENTFLIKIAYRAPDPVTAAEVANTIAASYVEHAFDSRDRSYLQVSQTINRQMKDLETKMAESGEALTKFNQKMNIVDPEQRVSILSARLMQLNTDYTAAQSDRLRKEAILNETKSGNLAAAQISSHADNLEHLIEQLNEARQEFAVVRTSYGQNQPDYKRAKNKLDELERQFQELRTNALDRVQADYSQAHAREEMTLNLVKQAKGEVDELNNSAFEYAQLKSQSEVYKRLYEDLQRVTREEDINRSFQDAVIQIEDTARPAAVQASPIMWLNLLIALLTSATVGIAGLLIYDQLDTKLRGAEQALRLLKVDVIASLPRKKRMTLLPGKSRSERVVGKMPKSERSRMLMQYQESIRLLRNNLDFSQVDQGWRSLLITSATEDEGKSTIAANLAFSYALVGKKVLLIDADMRRPSLHNIFDKKPVHGLAELISDKSDWAASLLKIAREHLFLLPAGKMSDNTADRLRTEFRTILELAYQEFDLVIVNGPPLLCAPEGAQIAEIVDRVIVSARAGASSANKVASALSLLTRAHANFAGLVLDEVQDGGVGEYLSIDKDRLLEEAA